MTDPKGYPSLDDICKALQVDRDRQAEFLVSAAIQFIESAIKIAPDSVKENLNTAANLLCEACGSLDLETNEPSN